MNEKRSAKKKESSSTTRKGEPEGGGDAAGGLSACSQATPSRTTRPPQVILADARAMRTEDQQRLDSLLRLLIERRLVRLLREK